MTPVALDTKTLKASLLAAVLAVAFCCAACGAEQSEAAQERESKPTPTPTADENSAPEIVGTKVPPAEPLAEESPAAPEESPAARETATATQNESPYERSAGVEPTFSSSGTDATEEDAPPARGEAKLYLQMTEDERREFIERRARHVSRMISSGTYEFGGDAVTLIKQYVDAYAQRVGNRSTATWGEDLNYVFGRAQRYAPTIIRAFNGRHVPPAIGLYIVAVETEYTNFPSNNFAGAAGLFQFVGDTAEQYRSEEHTSELQSRSDIVCRLLLEKKKKKIKSTILKTAVPVVLTAVKQTAPIGIRARISSVISISTSTRTIIR